jgi:hypothetical protein
VRSLGADVVVGKEDFAHHSPATTSCWTRPVAKTSSKSLRVLEPGGRAIGVAGPADRGFAKQLGAPKLTCLVMGC